MRWRGGRESSNVEDRRGQGGGFGLPGMGGGMRRGGGIGIGTLVIAMLVAWLFGINPLSMLGMLDAGGPVIQQPQPRPPQSSAGSPSAGSRAAPTDEAGQFIRVVLGSTEDVWQKLFQQSGSRYSPPGLVLYENMTGTACGTGSAAAGPFYCPADQKVYIDLSFYRTLHQKLGAPGDTAQAYVIAHEVGHHVQNLMGLMRKMDAARQQLSERDYNQLSIRLELQADCFAGIWAHHTQQARNWFDATDIEQAMNAAAAVGDDNIQRRTQGVVVKEAFTHGSSQQRARWFRTGMQTGSVDRCDTFAANAL